MSPLASPGKPLDRWGLPILFFLEGHQLTWQQRFEHASVTALPDCGGDSTCSGQAQPHGQQNQHPCCYCLATSVVSDSVRPHRRQPTRLPRPWDSPGKNTGVGCHFLLQCMKVKSQSEVAQSCLTLSVPMDCSLPGSSVHGIFLARALDWGAIAFYIMSTRAVKFKKTYYCIKCWCWQG